MADLDFIRNLELKFVMSKESAKNPEIDSRWMDLYRIGSIGCLLVAFLVLVAIVAYFIWPYTAMDESAKQIFQLLNDDLLGGLISLDMIMLFIMLINIIPILAIYASIRQANESYALIALVLQLIGVAAVIAARPLVEMSVLSDAYAQATTETERGYFLAAGEAFRTVFDGTAWAVQTTLFMIAGFINSTLFLKSTIYSRLTAWIGIVMSLLGLFFFLPHVGLIFLFLNTVLTIPFYLLVARSLYRLGWISS